MFVPHVLTTYFVPYSNTHYYSLYWCYYRFIITPFPFSFLKLIIRENIILMNIYVKWWTDCSEQTRSRPGTLYTDAFLTCRLLRLGRHCHGLHLLKFNLSWLQKLAGGGWSDRNQAASMIGAGSLANQSPYLTGHNHLTRRPGDQPRR